MIPLFIKIHLWRLRNRWWKGSSLAKVLFRDTLLCALFVFLIHSAYGGIITTLNLMQEKYGVIPHPTRLLHLIFLSVFGLLLFSNGITSITNYFLSENIERLLASPISKAKFFWSKFLETFAISSWMVTLFLIPILTAFGVYYETGPAIVLCFLFLIPFLMIPTAIMTLLCVGVARIFPAKRIKEGFIILGLFLMGAGYFALRSQTDPDITINSSKQLRELIEVASLPMQDYLPTYWLAWCIGGVFETHQEGIALQCLLLFGTSSLIVALSYLVFRNSYTTALLHAHSRFEATQFKSSIARRRFDSIKSLIPSYYRALFAKESKYFSRDLSQALQLVLILGLCFVYLYNFRMVQRLDVVEEQAKDWWQAFLILSNIFLGGLITTAVAARFVFPTMSLEGKSYWILNSCPQSLDELLKAKFWFWFIPVSTISTVIFTSGALAIHANYDIVGIHALCSWIISYGIVGMAIGLGAYFSEFEWEHSAQITASFGNFLYMVASTCFVIVLMLPISILVLLHTLRVLENPIPPASWYIAIAGCGFLICYLNHALAKWALRIGANRLRTKV